MTQDFTQLEQRIKAAFDRIDRGLEEFASARAQSQQATALADSPPVHDLPQGSPPHLEALLRALESAKSAAEDWAQRFATLQKQSSEETLAMANEISRLTRELQAARAGGNTAPAPASAQASHDAEIDALTARIAEQEAELESLRAARAIEASELGELIAQLSPLVEEVSNV